MRQILKSTALVSALALASAPALAIDGSVGGGVGVGAGVGAGASAGAGVGVGTGGSGVGATAGATAGTSATTGVSGATVGTEGTAATNLGVRTGTSETEEATTEAAAGLTAESVVGAQVVSSDGALIGTVSDVQVGADGRTSLVTTVDQGLGLDTDNVQIMADAATAVDQQVQLNATAAEFTAAIQTQLEGSANAQAQGEAQ